MKRLIPCVVCVTLLFFINQSYGQAADSTVSVGKYYYSQVIMHIGGFNKHKSTRVSFGTDYELEIEQEYEIKTKMKSFEDPVDAMNYMSDFGWEYVDGQSMLFNEFIVLYTFRKARE